MGLYDRDYYRDDEPRGFQLAMSQSVVVNLVIVNVVIYLIDVLLQIGLSFGRGEPGILGLRADLIERPWQFYQLLTYGFAHSPDPWHVLFNMLALWFFGRDVEAIYGRKEFFQLYCSLLICAGLCWLITTRLTAPGATPVLVGASGAVAGVLAIFVCHYPTRTLYVNFFIPMPAWILGLLWLLRDLSGAFYGDSNVAYTAHLGGAAFGLLFYKTRFQLGRLVPQRWPLPKFAKRQPPLRVHRPEREASLTEQADAILEKIAQSGQDSLTKNERRILEEYSRRMQQKHR